jgi:hypothetical protein
MKLEQAFYNELFRSSVISSKPICQSVDESYKDAIREVTNRHKIMVAAYHNTELMNKLIPDYVQRDLFLAQINNMFEQYKTLKKAPTMQLNMSNFFERLMESQAPF